nr:alanine racemase [Nocardioides marmotae]
MPAVTPFLCVDLDRLRRNVRVAAEFAAAHQVALRPHVKTHKSPEIARLQLAHGASGVTVATIGEAELFARHGCEDVFIASPLWLDERAAARVRELAEKATVAFAVDSAAGAANAGRLLGRTPVEVLVEVDSGQHRTGVRPEEAGEVATTAVRAGLEVRGVFTFPGHSYAPGAVEQAARDEAAALAAARASLEAAGVEVRVVSGGSTPTFQHTDTSVVTELRPGVYVFNDAQQWELGTVPRTGSPCAAGPPWSATAAAAPCWTPGASCSAPTGLPGPPGTAGCRRTPTPASSWSRRTVPWSTWAALRSPASARRSTSCRTTCAPPSTSSTTCGSRRPAGCGRGRWPPAASTAEAVAPTIEPMLKRPLAALATLAAVSLLASCGDDESSPDAGDSPAASASSGSEKATPSAEGASGPTCVYPQDGQPAAKDVELPPNPAAVKGTIEGSMATTIGDIGISLDAKASPCTVNSFVSLAEQGYFDDTTCHRLTTADTGIQVLQCGDPTGTGTGGPGYTIEDEVTPDTTYPAGTLAMAKTPAPDSGGSQFFIVYGDTPLPPEYTVFGSIDEAGLKAVQEAAAEGTTDGGPEGQPKVAVDIESVTIDD